MKKEKVNQRHKQITEIYEPGIEKLMETKENAPSYYYERN